MLKLNLLAQYSQVCVFDALADDNFNDWDKEHVDQGFAWRPHSISFGTILDGGGIECRVLLPSSKLLPIENPIRIILLPFTVPDHGCVCFASVGDDADLEMPPGLYALRFEHGLTENGYMWANFIFTPSDKPVEPQIILADEELSNPPNPLNMTAVAAV